MTRTRRPLSPAQAAMLAAVQVSPRLRAEMYEAALPVAANRLAARMALTDLSRRELVMVEFDSLEPKGSKGIFHATKAGNAVLWQTLWDWREVLNHYRAMGLPGIERTI